VPVVDLVTCAALPGGDEDGPALTAALARRGITARWRVWNDPAVDWSAGTLAVIRSPWDYTQSLERFLAWARHVPRLVNPAEVVTWSADKVYLAELASEGVPVVPSAFVRPGTAADLPADGEYVVKPSVGAGARGAARFAAGERSAGHRQVATLHERGFTALVQPYLHAIDTRGETALMYLDGQYSHAISKAALLPPATGHRAADRALYARRGVTDATASPAELAVGEQVLALLRRRFGADQLYARVDLLPGPDGPLLGELELAEPSLFLEHAAGAADRFAAAIADRL
jgi:hypothetical protein